jgi:DNA-binding NtrC family response regulator
MSNRLRMLIVEHSDEETQLLLVRLHHAGYEPSYLRVNNAADMAHALQSEDWQVVICGYSPTGFSALDALQVFRQQQRDIPFIIVSSAVGEERAVEAMRN